MTEEKQKISKMTFQAKAYWAMVLGNPRKGYMDSGDEWSIDLSLDQANKDKLLKAGIGAHFIKNRGDEKGDYIKLVRKAINSKGNQNQPISVVDAHNEAWDQSKLIGNGSTVNISVALHTTSQPGKPKDVYLKPQILSMQVWDHQEYKPDPTRRKSDFPVKEAHVNGPQVVPSWETTGGEEAA